MSFVRGHGRHFWHTHTRFPPKSKIFCPIKIIFALNFIDPSYTSMHICSDIFFSILPIKIWIMYFISPPNWPNFERLLFLGHKWVSSSSSAAISIPWNAQGTGALTPRWLSEAASSETSRKRGINDSFLRYQGLPRHMHKADVWQ